MRAVAYEQFRGPITLRTVPDPAPPDDGVVIRVRATGICRSDWHGWMGHDSDCYSAWPSASFNPKSEVEVPGGTGESPVPHGDSPRGTEEGMNFF